MAYTYNPLSGNFDYYKTYSSSDFDHGGLTGLSDDDHTQYALLAGRSGGQTLIGGTASGNDLTLQSTSDATRGSIFFGSAANSQFDEVNSQLLLGGTTSANSDIILGEDGSAIFNQQGNDADFRIEGDTLTHLFFVDASADLIGINSSAPNARLDIRGSWTATAANNGAFKIDSTIDDGGFNLQAIQLSPVIDVNASGTNQVIRAVPTVRPVTAITGTYMGLNNNLTIGGSSANAMTTVIANNATVVRGGTYTGVITTVMSFRADAPASWALGQVTNYTGYQAATASIGNGLTTGTLTLRGLQVQGFTAAANGGTINAYGIEVTVPSGSNAGNTSRGIYITGNGGALATKHALYSDSTADSYFAGEVGIGVTSPVSLLDVSSATGGIMTLSRADTTATAADVIGTVQWWNNDATLTTQNIYANIEVQAAQTITTDAAAGKMIIRTTGTTAGGSPEERITLVPTETVINDGGLDKDFRGESDDATDLFFFDAGADTGAGAIGFFSVTPQIQQATIADADGTLADITTKFNTLLADLEGYGLLKSA